MRAWIVSPQLTRQPTPSTRSRHAPLTLMPHWHTGCTDSLVLSRGRTNLGQIQWDMPAILVPPGNHPNYTGTLSACLRHWRDQLGPVQQVTAMIAMAGGR